MLTTRVAWSEHIEAFDSQPVELSPGPTAQAACEARRKELNCAEFFSVATEQERPLFFDCTKAQDRQSLLSSSNVNKVYSCAKGGVRVVVDSVVGLVLIPQTIWTLVSGSKSEGYPSSCSESLETKTILLGALRPPGMTTETIEHMGCADIQKFVQVRADAVLAKLESRRQSQMAETGQENLNVFSLKLSDQEIQALNYGRVGALSKIRCYRPEEQVRATCAMLTNVAISSTALRATPMLFRKLGRTSSAALDNTLPVPVPPAPKLVGPRSLLEPLSAETLAGRTVEKIPEFGSPYRLKVVIANENGKTTGLIKLGAVEADVNAANLRKLADASEKNSKLYVEVIDQAGQKVKLPVYGKGYELVLRTINRQHLPRTTIIRLGYDIDGFNKALFKMVANDQMDAPTAVFFDILKVSNGR